MWDMLYHRIMTVDLGGIYVLYLLNKQQDAQESFVTNSLCIRIIIIYEPILNLYAFNCQYA